MGVVISIFSARAQTCVVCECFLGDFDGLGDVRKIEIMKSCQCLGISRDHVTVMDDK